MTPHRYIVILSALSVIIMIAAGCTTMSPGQNTTPVGAPSGEPLLASYKVTINQPDTMSEYIHMDTDRYNIGEVVQFTVTNDGSGPLECAGDPPAFSVKFQGINGMWVTRMGNETPGTPEKSSLEPGASTVTYRFVTDGWAPGRYRIVHDCGVVREFILRPVPTLAATPVETLSLNETVNSTVATPAVATMAPLVNPPATATVTLPANTSAPPYASSRNPDS